MKVMIAYGLVIALTSFCFFAGALLVIFLGTQVLAKASPRLREIVVGGLSGLVGVAASFTFSYFLFRLLCGTDAFGLFPLLAATVPLILPIRKEFAKSQLLFNDIEERRRHPSPTVRKTLVDLDSRTYAMAMSARFRAVGAVLGVSLAFIWLFFVYQNAAT